MQYEKLKNKVKDEYLHKDARLVIGVSGGPDSMLLLYLLNELKEEENLDLTVVHINHMLRKEAEEEAEFVKSQCEKMQIACFVFAQDVKGIAKAEKISEEAAGHLVRYRYFDEVMAKVSAEYLVLGHHLNDRGESVLLNILRGTSPDGLAVLYGKEKTILRPLSTVTKAEILDMCKEREIPYCWDKSNDEVICTRNKIRLELMPYLRREFNPQLDEALCRLSDLAWEDAQYWQEETKKAYEDCKVSENGLSVSKLGQLPVSLKRRTLEWAWQRCADARRLSMVQIEGILRLLEDNKGRKVLDLGDYEVVKEYDLLTFRLKAQDEAQDFSFEWDMQSPLDLGEYVLCGKILENATEELEQDKFCVWFEQKYLPQKLLVRNRRAGDCIKTESGTKKVKKLFIDEKVPNDLRNQIPLVFANDELLWVVGVRRSGLYKEKTGEGKVVVLYLKEKKEK